MDFNCFSSSRKDLTTTYYILGILKYILSLFPHLLSENYNIQVNKPA